MIFDALMDLLFPRACVGCGRPARDAFLYFCWNCLAGLEVIHPPFCALCGDPADGAVAGGYRCSNCSSSPPAFDLARSALRYRGILQSALQDFKYRNATWLVRDFGVFLEACCKSCYSGIAIDTLTFVPLFLARERSRSYNQSWLLARELGARLRGPATRELLVKLRPTPTQTHLTAAARRANVRGVFAVRKGAAVAGRRVLLVDDVMTTGATLHECARALKQAGADSVYALTLARG